MAVTPVGGDGQTLRMIRRVLLILLFVAFVGTFVELVLLEHDEDPSQVIPLVLLAGSVLTLAWTAVRPGALAVASFRVVMVLLIVSGALGLALHFQANVEFQRDLAPDATFVELFWKVMAAKAPPALAPAVLAQFGCLGLVYSYRLLPADTSRTAGQGESNAAIR